MMKYWFRRRFWAMAGAMTLFAASLAAQGPPSGVSPGSPAWVGGPTFPGYPPFVIYSLELTPAQLAGMNSILASARTAAQPIELQVNAVRAELKTAIRMNYPVSEIERLVQLFAETEKQETVIMTRAFVSFYTLLTPAQRERLDTWDVRRGNGD